MVARRRGAIVNVASINALGGQSGRVNYSASKAAMLGIARTLAIEWGRFGVRVNVVAPQLIETPGCGGQWPACRLPYRGPRRGSRFPGVRGGDGSWRRGRLGGMCRSARTFMIRPPCPNSMEPGADEGLG